MHPHFVVSARTGDPNAVIKLENSRLLRAEIAARREVLRALPEIVTFHNTDICNLRCVMCPRHLGQGTHALDDDLLRLVADELLPTALKANLTSAGGEPMGVGFEVLLERVLRHATRLDVTTNGLLMTREKFLAMQPALDHLNVSVDCVVPEIYERIRVGASFDKLAARLAMVAELRRANPDGMLFSLSAVVMASTLPHLPELIHFAARHGADGVVLQRLQHDVMPTWHEDVTRHFSAEEIERHLDAAEAAARAAGVSLVSSGFGRAPLWIRPVRSKVPDPLDGHGICSFLTQTFTLMFTGEVYPCCKPTDYRLGDVHRDSAFEIWNGAPLRNLRRAHYDRQGTVFCSGCELAPHLPARPLPRLQQALRSTRRWIDNRRIERNDRREHPSRAAATAPPPHHRIAAAVTLAPAATRVEALPGPRDATAFDHRNGSLWILRAGWLCRAPHARAAATPVLQLDPSGRRGCLLQFVRRGVLLASFEGGGAVLRIDTEVTPLAPVIPLRLSDERASVRTAGLAVGDDGVIWVGEYGVAPGLRCAIVHRSRDGGRSFTQLDPLPPARHVHAVAISPQLGQVLVTTGDLGIERATIVADLRRPRWRRWLAPWSGFTAIASTPGWTHFGTDLEHGNGLVRIAAPRAGEAPATPELRQLPEEFDLQVRQIEVLRDHSLVALLSMDGDLPAARAGKRALLMRSHDHGASWSVVHHFAADWSDAAERFLVVAENPLTVVTDGVDHALLLQFGDEAHRS
ncbi:MAG: radical SAM protein [Planctomycetes bacterium]|nr:radical SAM protein [Planctomycetota bacterium]